MPSVDPKRAICPTQLYWPYILYSTYGLGAPFPGPRYLDAHVWLTVRHSLRLFVLFDDLVVRLDDFGLLLALAGASASTGFGSGLAARCAGLCGLCLV